MLMLWDKASDPQVGDIIRKRTDGTAYRVLAVRPADRSELVVILDVEQIF